MDLREEKTRMDIDTEDDSITVERRGEVGTRSRSAGLDLGCRGKAKAKGAGKPGQEGMEAGDLEGLKRALEP